MLNQANIGTESWWQEVSRLGTPLRSPCSENNNNMVLTFLWRDRQGDENQSETKAVFIDINGVTDVFNQGPAQLTRVNGSDVWYWQMTIEKNWRGSYRLLPIGQSKLPDFNQDEQSHWQDKQRQWWQSLQPWAVTDPLNRTNSGRTLWEKHWSAVHLPDAPIQNGWSSFNLSACHTSVFRWHSTILGNGRNIWIYAPTASNTPAQERPVVLLLDGEFWARSMPVFSMLANNTHTGHLKDAVYVLVDAIDSQHRSQEQACNQQFWQAIRYELLPQLPKRIDNFSGPSETILVGQSFAALSVLYAGLNWPEVFNRVICQSGAFWWPHIELMAMAEEATANISGLLTRQIQSGRFNHNSLEVFLQFGSREKAIAKVNQQLNEALSEAGIEVALDVYNGGHDKLCWRGGMVDGLRHFQSHARIKRKLPQSQSESGNVEKDTANSFWQRLKFAI